MFQQLLNFRTFLAIIAILIVSGTVWYSSYLADKIEKEERNKVTLWVEASRAIADPENTDTRLPLLITQQNDIPIIATNERDSILEWVNLDSAKVEEGWKPDDKAKLPNTNTFLRERMKTFRSAKMFVEL